MNTDFNFIKIDNLNEDIEIVVEEEDEFKFISIDEHLKECNIK